VWFGLAPALNLSRVDPAPRSRTHLAAHRDATPCGAFRFGLRQALVVAEVALAVADDQRRLARSQFALVRGAAGFKPDAGSAFELS
jgi:hypothetical protein